MDRIRWSEIAVPFQNVANSSAITKPALVLMKNKAVIVGEKLTGEFILASPFKVFGDKFDIKEQEIVLSSTYTGIWKIISKVTNQKEGFIHRLTTRELEIIHKQDTYNKRPAPRTYICIRDVEAFELIAHSNDVSIANGNHIERRVRYIEENVEFEIYDSGEVEYTPSEGERTSQDYVMVPKLKQGIFLQLLLPGFVEQEQVIRNRVVRALYCSTKGERHKHHFLLEINEKPCEIRPVASYGSTELRYLHSTQNLYNYMISHGNDTVLYVKLLRGDPPIKAAEDDGYMVLKSVLNGEKVPICRVEDLEITLVSVDLPIKVRLPTRSEHEWRSLAQVRAAEAQCMQMSLTLLARQDSELYTTTDARKSSHAYAQPIYNETPGLRTTNRHRPSAIVKKHIEECEQIFSTPNVTYDDDATPRSQLSHDKHVCRRQSIENQLRTLSLSKKRSSGHNASHPRTSSSSSQPKNEIDATMSHSPRGSLHRHSRTHSKRTVSRDPVEQNNEYNRIHRVTIRKDLIFPVNSIDSKKERNIHENETK